jgi:type IV pilus assembly protein PilY1
MRGSILAAIVGLVIAAFIPSAAVAAIDEFAGDTAIYGMATAEVQPNVLIILDSSGSMDGEIDTNPFLPETIFAGTYQANTVYAYQCVEQRRGPDICSWQSHVADVNDVTTSCEGNNIRNSLQTTGQYSSSKRSLNSNGSCNTKGSGSYATGNWLNWTALGGSEMAPKIDVAKEVLANLVNSTDGVNFGVMVFNGESGGKFLDPSVAGSKYPTVIKDMDAIHTGTTTNRQALLSVVAGINADSWTPLAESLFEAMRYFKGEASAFGINDSDYMVSSKYVSPIEASCQQNYVVLITDGMSTKDKSSVLRTICTAGDVDGDCDGDENEPDDDPSKNYDDDGSDYLDDVAHYLFRNDMSPLTGTQNVTVFTVGFGLGGANSSAVELLNETAANGGGRAYLAENSGQLSSSLQQILGEIFEVDTSFVAPVVPTSPENRTYSGNRVYLGFFKPITNMPWRGNLKKYGISKTGQIVDKNGNVATFADGNFIDNAVSFWSFTADAGDVEEGGAGSVLRSRVLAAEARNIYTYRGSSVDLTDASNAFTTINISAADLGIDTGNAAVDNTARDKVVNYLRGFDPYDDDGDGNNTEVRDWILGDILHSKPQIVNYNTFTFNAANEADPNVNKTMIYVGSNDGMLHAFRDADGEELWAFVPDHIWPNLPELGTRPTPHLYFVDASPVVYTFDKDNDGNIGLSEAADGDSDNGADDKVVLIFGQRRGGDAYYALDVTNPAAPSLLWKITPDTPGFERLGETWSDPQIGRMKIGTDQKIVAFVGGGYDTYEDSRFGNAWQFPDTYNVSNLGTGNVASLSTYNPSEVPTGTDRLTGRAVYAIEIANVTSGVPVVATSPTLVKAIHPQYSATLKYDYSFASDIAVLDTDFNGFVDRLYVGNTGGQMWRFEVGSTDPNAWTQKAIFWDYSGAKFFYRPSVTYEAGYTFLFFGTGDREHPLNTNGTDRFYAFKDRNVFKWHTDSSIVNVTGNELQTANPPADPETCIATDNSIKCILERLNSSTNFGWFIDLNLQVGEKVLASPLAFNKVAYFTTFTPNATLSSDPCQSGNLGVSRLYAVNYKTGEAVLNFNNAVTTPTTNNDNESTANNKRARSKDGKVLRRADRSIVLGIGIPSGLVVVMPPSGDAELLIGCGGGICSEDPVPGGTIIPVYWMKW